MQLPSALRKCIHPEIFRNVFIQSPEIDPIAYGTLVAHEITVSMRKYIYP